MSMRLMLIMTMAAMFAFAWPNRAEANDPSIAIGARPIGFSADPDQYVVGGQTVLAHMGVFRFAPSVDVGFGDDLRMLTVNADAQLDLFTFPGARVGLYAGGGPTVSYIDPNFGQADTEIGLSVLGGVKVPFGSAHYYNVEARYGFGDIPEFKLMLGIMLGLGENE